MWTYRWGEFVKDFISFHAPVTLTIHYSDSDVKKVADESHLNVYWWTGNEWQDAAESCHPVSAYVRNPANNTIRVPICKIGQFGLYAVNAN